MNSWLKKLHTWSLQWAGTKWGMWSLFICAFADSSFLPLPTPMFFLALALLNITKIKKYVFFATLGTLSGAIAGYAIGHFAWLNMHGEFTGFAQFLLINIPGFSEEVYNKIHVLYSKWDFWILFIASALPLPYKIFSISSGVFDINIFIFCIATLVSQGIKFSLLALIILKIGPEVKKLLEIRLKYVAIATTACIAIVILAFKIF